MDSLASGECNRSPFGSADAYSIDLDVPLTNVGGLTTGHTIPGAQLQPGQVIIDDRLGDSPAEAYPRSRSKSHQISGLSDSSP